MKKNYIEGFILGMVVGAVIVVSIIATSPFERRGYKRGQIDALTGTVKYELIEHENKTKTWEWIKIQKEE